MLFLASQPIDNLGCSGTLSLRLARYGVMKVGCGFFDQSVLSDSFSTFGRNSLFMTKPRWASGSALDVAIDAAAKDSFPTCATMIYNRRVSAFSTTASAKLAQGFALAANGGFPPNTDWVVGRFS